MRVPIAYGLSYPDRLETGVEHLNCLTLNSLEFEEPDHERFPALKMVEAVLNAGGIAPIFFNAANEIAVEAFLNNKISFLSIYDVVNKTLDKMHAQEISSISHAIAEDEHARTIAKEIISLY